MIPFTRPTSSRTGICENLSLTNSKIASRLKLSFATTGVLFIMFLIGSFASCPSRKPLLISPSVTIPSNRSSVSTIRANFEPESLIAFITSRTLCSFDTFVNTVSPNISTSFLSKCVRPS